MGIKMVAGRDFDDHDRQGTPPVAIVNHTFVNRYLSGRNPLAVQFTAGYPTIDEKTVWTIVGVVDDVRQQSLSAAPEAAYYTSWGQGLPRRQTVIIRASADSAGLRSSIRDEIHKLDPQIPVEIERVPDLVSSTINRQQLGMTLMLVFAVAAIALAAVGIYGVIAYSATQRTKEMAIRMALGASPRDAFGLVCKQGGTLTIIGTMAGLLMAYLAGQVVSGSLYQVRASDPLILSGAAIVVIVIAVSAIVIPAYRVTRLDPGHVLRPE
jgi:ABC-type antimicrobial peptide transport system permease subunit